MKSSVKLDYILVCEDIRHEVGHKPSAMGIFTDNILVRDFPYMFPKLCFLVHLLLVRPRPKLKLSAQFRFTSSKPLVLAKDQELKIQKPKGGLIIQFILSPCKFEKAGVGELVLTVDGRNYRRHFSVSKAEDLDVFRR